MNINTPNSNKTFVGQFFRNYLVVTLLNNYHFNLNKIAIVFNEQIDVLYVF